MIQRIKTAWAILTGKILIPPHVYVRETKPPNQFVQLLTWRDSILALDAEGKIWELRQDNLPGFLIQLLQESPRSY